MSDIIFVTFPAQWGGTMTSEQADRLRLAQGESTKIIAQYTADDEWRIAGQSSAALPMLGDLGTYHVLYVTVSLVKVENIVTFTSATKSEQFNLDTMQPVVKDAETVEQSVTPEKRTRKAAK
jgi:hypothetical protein